MARRKPDTLFSLLDGPDPSNNEVKSGRKLSGFTGRSVSEDRTRIAGANTRCARSARSGIPEPAGQMQSSAGNSGESQHPRNAAPAGLPGSLSASCTIVLSQKYVSRGVRSPTGLTRQLRPLEWRSVCVRALHEQFDLLLELARGVERVATDSALGDQREPAFDPIEPQIAGKREVQMHARIARQPRPDLGILVRDVVVYDQVQIQLGRRLFVDVSQEAMQRSPNENTNGLLWQYFPKGTDLSRWSAREIKPLLIRKLKAAGNSWMEDAREVSEILCAEAG